MNRRSPARRWRWSRPPPPFTGKPAARWATPASSAATAGASGWPTPSACPMIWSSTRGWWRQGVVKVNDEAHLAVDAGRRRRIARHHTATHILQAVLQAAPGRARQAVRLAGLRRSACASILPTFRPSRPKKWSGIELDLNAAVAENLPVHTDRMSVPEALERGATALFEEKYGDEVRVVAIPGPEPGALRRHPRGAHRRSGVLQDYFRGLRGRGHSGASRRSAARRP